jgi:hypothetical protein
VNYSGLKGFALNEARLRDGRDDAFEALLERVRAIRASDGCLSQKLADLLATSLDYDPDHPMTRGFSARVQEKLRWAVRGATAAGRSAEAAASQPPGGLPAATETEERIREAEIAVARDELTAEEQAQMERLVEQYLAFAELQAALGNEMRMADWEAKLDELLRLNDYPIR